MKKAFLFLAVGLSLFMTAFAEMQAPTELSVAGHGEAILIPSQATIWLVPYYKGPDLGELFGRLEVEAERLRGVIKKIGIPEKDIKDEGSKITQNYSDTGNAYQWDRYTLSRNLIITVRDLKLVDKILAKAKEEEIDQINGPNFDYPDRGKVEDAALQNAIADAKKKAEALANGKKLSDPQISSKNINTTLMTPSDIPGEERLSVDLTATF